MTNRRKDSPDVENKEADARRDSRTYLARPSYQAQTRTGKNNFPGSTKMPRADFQSAGGGAVAPSS